MGYITYRDELGHYGCMIPEDPDHELRYEDEVDSHVVYFHAEDDISTMAYWTPSRVEDPPDPSDMVKRYDAGAYVVGEPEYDED